MLIIAAATFLYLVEGDNLPFAGIFHPIPRDEKESSAGGSSFAAFPSDFPIDFLGKLTEIANGGMLGNWS